MPEASRHGDAKGWKATFWLSALLMVLAVASLAPYLTSSTEIVRMRNALVYDSKPAQADWTPAALPENYLAERAPPTSTFSRVVEEHGLIAQGDDWETALRIGRQLLSGVVAHGGNGGAIQSGLDETYREITATGRGYCGDYVDVFTALANASGIFSRSWAFSFGGFDGHGHIFNEIWDRKTASWRMIDVFNNYYVVDEDERPLSALEFREALLGAGPVRWRAVEPDARPGYESSPGRPSTTIGAVPTSGTSGGGTTCSSTTPIQSCHCSARRLTRSGSCRRSRWECIRRSGCCRRAQTRRSAARSRI